MLGTRPVTERYRIEDLVVQDSTGVLFRAVDEETGRPVALRRLLPNGPGGAGLENGEAEAYQDIVRRLAGISHPALRAVLGGGCDPVDGMPFIVTEWMEGIRLQRLLDQGPLGNREAVDLLGRLLEVSELLSRILGRDGVWVETDPRTIVVGAAESGRGVTFWISPLKWLSGTGRTSGLESVVTLAEEAKDWREPGFGDDRHSDLGHWLEWLRGAAPTTTTHEARQRLADSVGGEAPVSPRKLVCQARLRRWRPWALASAAAGFAGLALAGGWIWNQENARRSSGGDAPAPAAAPGAPADWLDPMDRSIATRRGEEVAIGGVMRSIERSQSGKTLYLGFSTPPELTGARGAIPLATAPPELQETALAPLIGKKIRIQGRVRMEGPSPRPAIVIEGREAIRIIE